MAALTLSGLRRAVSWHRRTLAAGCAVLAVLATVAAVSPEAPEASPVVVAGGPLPGGTRLSGTDLEVRRVDAAALPDAALTDPAALVGRTLTAPVTAGTMLTEADVVAPRGEQTDGGVLAPVRVSDPEVAALLRVGDRVDVLGADPGTGEVVVLAPDARVASVPTAPAEGGLFSPGSSGGGALLLVEVPPATALRLAGASAAGPVSLVLG
ncbi:Flp pilus assembly protein CpaB [Auraticoccus sp. F435]|uniref:Flp pilus assembly protein CpaB n=1 Tax=Auraticoccus cholistanensis TaxID=2656650 RepID=A0A6A9UY41_9ACTN|nr:SAF domain-containing protein [Auraticoccus cholistanensis]MVA76604.1 Flp pilus assembly protein CpaB [Auraticoccus cholistanensis]